MIQLKESELARIMFDIWRKSDDLTNLVMASDYIRNEVLKVKNLSLSSATKRVQQLKCSCEKPKIVKEFIPTNCCGNCNKVL
jgi:hypothetical protein